MNNNLMMLLPLLMKKGGGISPDMLMKMFANGNTGMEGNPMLALMAVMMGGMAKQAPENPPETKKTPDTENIFGADVMNVLKLFMELNKKNGNQSPV